MRVTIGIDAGVSGAVAAIYEDGRLDINDIPTITVGKRRQIDAPEFLRILRHYLADDLHYVTSGMEVFAGLELVHSQPRDGAVGAFSFGRSFGNMEMALTALGIPHRLVRPQEWMKAMGVGADKENRRLTARRVFPLAADQLNLKKHNGRADALLIAAYLRGTFNR